MSGKSKTVTVGPVQLMVIGFPEPDFTGEIIAELDRLREHKFVRVIDALVVQKDDDGNLTAVQASDLSQEEATALGTIAGALVGFGYGGDEAVVAGAELGAAEMEDGHLIPDARCGTSPTRSPMDPSRPFSCWSTCGPSRFAMRS